jgi:hypothetical protein
VAIVFLLAASCSDEPPVPAGPSAEFPDKHHSFGDVVQGRRVEHVFEVRNRGSADLVLDKVEASEVLTVESYDKVVPPGGSGRIRIAFATAGLHGVGKLALRVHTNDPAARGERRGSPWSTTATAPRR